MNSIRCAFVASYYGPYYSNFVASMISFQKKMKERNYSVIFVLPEEVREFKWISLLGEQNTKVYFLEYKPYSIGNVMSFRKIFREERINIVYSHMCGWDFTTRVAAPTIPVIWHMRMFVNIEDRVKRIKNFIKFKFIGFGKTYHIASSSPVADAINTFHPHNRCVAIHNSLDFSRLHTVDFKERIGTPVRVLLFGWAPYVKGLDIALDACERINKDAEIVHLYVSAQEETFKYISERYCQKRPTWVYLLEPTDDISSLYDRVDVMLSASRSEGFSFSLAEAIYSGLPVIYSDIPGTNWADEFENAFSFESANPDDLARAIRVCMESSFSEEKRKKNQELMESNFSLDVWTAKVIAFMEKI